jgi:hypothetical protein
MLWWQQTPALFAGFRTCRSLVIWRGRIRGRRRGGRSRRLQVAATNVRLSGARSRDAAAFALDRMRDLRCVTPGIGDILHRAIRAPEEAEKRQYTCQASQPRDGKAQRR